MRQFTYTIQAPGGIHAVPASLLARQAKRYTSFITIAKDTAETDITNLLKVMSMSVMQGDTVTVCAEGEDEEAAVDGMEDFFRRYL